MNTKISSNRSNIEHVIGYTFKNVQLLEQAFTRKSYAEEHKEAHHNDVLEFIGDAFLGAAVTQKLAATLRDTNIQVYYETLYDSGDFTEYKKFLVNKIMLADRITALNLYEFLLVGKGDTKLNIEEENSVKEDLFEAIIGAVAIDSNFSVEVINQLVYTMLDIDKYMNDDIQKSISNMIDIQKYCQKHFDNTAKIKYNDTNIVVSINDNIKVYSSDEDRSLAVLDAFMFLKKYHGYLQ